MYQNEKQKSELIDKYLRNELGAEDRRQFEETLNRDAGLSLEVKEHERFISDLKNYEKKTQLRKKLNDIHSEINAGDAGKTNQRFLRTDYIRMATAACITVLIAFGVFFMIDHWENKQNAYYKELRRDLEKIKKSQNNIIKDISTNKPNQEQGKYSGTGFALSSNGYIVTSYHIIKDARTVFVENKNNQRYKVKVILKDIAKDLAILKVAEDGFKGFGIIPYALKIRPADLGEQVYTLGYPREDIVYGEGSVSAGTGFEGDSTAYQISIPVNPGNSGGPLFDTQGNLIGIISGKHSESEGTAFAIKADYLMKLVNTFRQDSLNTLPNISKNNSLKPLKRPDQLKRIRNFVFVVKVYN